jgi:hypothetical protein
MSVGEETRADGLEAGVGNRKEANRDLIYLGETMSKTTWHEKNLETNTISWILTSWKGLKRQARVCMCKEPLMLFLTHSFSFWQSAIGVNSFIEKSNSSKACRAFVRSPIPWTVSEPRTSQVYA